MLNRITAVTFLVLLAGALLAAPAAYAQTTWYVDDDAPADPGPGDPTVSDPLEDGSADHPFDAIQEGIDAAVDGDEVLVLDGTYTGTGNTTLDYAGKAITVMSEHGPEMCTIDCESSGYGFFFDDGESSAAIADGFTITGGLGNNGSGIFCTNGSGPTIQNCIITGNHAYVGGAGVNCGIDTGVTLLNCLITNNTSDVEGGGIRCNASTATVVNCTIVGNQSGNGGGVYLEGGGELLMANCVLSGNVAAQGPEGCVAGSSTLTISYSDVDGGQTEISVPNGTLNWGDGMIDADPQFVDPDGGDLHLLSGSACIDAGTNEPPGGLPPEDLDGDPRPLDGDGNVEPWSGQAATADMGAYEGCRCIGDLNGDDDVDLTDLAILLSNYGQWGMGWEDGDLTGDTYVGLDDLAILLAVYGTTCN